MWVRAQGVQTTWVRYVGVPRIASLPIPNHEPCKQKINIRRKNGLGSHPKAANGPPHILSRPADPTENSGSMFELPDTTHQSSHNTVRGSAMM